MITAYLLKGILIYTFPAVSALGVRLFASRTNQRLWLLSLISGSQLLKIFLKKLARNARTFRAFLRGGLAQIWSVAPA